MAVLKGRTLILKSGRELKLNGPIFINNELELGEGYSPIFLRRNTDHFNDSSISPVSNSFSLTVEEIADLAEYYTTLWQRLSDNALKYGINSADLFKF